jgi:hypothetical protein
MLLYRPTRRNPDKKNGRRIKLIWRDHFCSLRPILLLYRNAGLIVERYFRAPSTTVVGTIAVKRDRLLLPIHRFSFGELPHANYPRDRRTFF